MAGSGSEHSSVDGEGLRFAIVAARFHAPIVDALLAGATATLVAAGVRSEDLLVVRVPGAWEVPLALEILATRGGYDGLVALGAVVRGDTPHFDVVVDGCAGGASRVQERHRVPVGMGVLTCDTYEQALDRAGGKLGNKGSEAAVAALEMVALLRQLAP